MVKQRPGWDGSARRKGELNGGKKRGRERPVGQITAAKGGREREK